jgi:hypothetical protein
MRLRFGGQTVTFVAVTSTGEPGRLGLTARLRSETPVKGCHFRPAGATESHDEQTSVATGLWKATVPPVDAALAAQPTDEVKVDGVEYQIEGPVQPKHDWDGSVHHVTIMCKRQQT